MATFFGEVLPVYSRAVDEDEDFEIEENKTSETIVRWSPAAQQIMSKPKDFTKKGIVILNFGAGATGFSKAYILENKEVELLGVVCSGAADDEVSTFEQTSYTDKTCFIYRLKLKPHVIIVQCQAHVSDQHFESWTNVVFEGVSQLLNLQAHSSFWVYVLHSLPQEQYKAEHLQSDVSQSFLKCLKTSAFQDDLAAPLLEIPNTVVGLPAQVLTYCEVHNLPAVCYVGYTESACLGYDFIKVFQPIFQLSTFGESVRANAYGDKVAADLASKLEQYNSLYV